MHPYGLQHGSGFEHFGDGGRLGASHLQPDPASGPQYGVQTGHQPADHVQPVLAGSHRGARLPLPHLGRGAPPLRVAEVRGVRKHQVEAPVPDRFEQRAAPEVDPGDPRLRGIPRGGGQGAGGNIGGGNRPGHALRGQSQGDGSRAGAHFQGRIEDAVGAGQPQQDIDQVLGLGTGDRHPAVDMEVQRPERGRAQDVLQGFPGPAPAQERLEARQLVPGEGAVEMQVELKPPSPEDVGKEVFGIESPLLHPPFAQVVATDADNLHDGPDALLRCRNARGHKGVEPSRSRSSSRASRNAETISSRSPSSTSARRYRLSPMRWSVTRFCGKL